MDAARLVKLVQMVVEQIQPRRCKYCDSLHVVRQGHNKQGQRLLCRDCHRTCMDDDSIPGMKTPKEQIASALDMYYEGMSLNAIRRHLEQMYHNYPSDSSVYNWITKFSEVAIKEAEKQKPNVGDVWVADETVLKIEGKNTWFWDIIDSETRFLLASHISTVRTTRDARKLMEKAAQRAGKTPKVIVTDKLRAYLDGVELAFGSETKHIQTKPFTVEQNTNLIERFHGTLKDRTKVMRGLKSRESAKLLTEGWLVHYNFFRTHDTLGKTPAEAAGIKFPYKDWLDITKSPIVTYVTEKPRTIRMKLSPSKATSMRIRPPRTQGQTPRGVFYEGHGMVSRYPFRGGKRRGRII